jgi:DNA-binding NarL/FixJ family response regulator
MAKSEKPDILFMDISLSGKMDGIEAAETIARNAPIAIVFMTGYSNQSIIDRASALAPAAYLVKPFDFSAIDGILASIG